MITIDFLVAQNGKLIGFDIKGHSGSAEAGSDIICASVSSVAYMVANTITEVILVSADILVEKDGRMYLSILEKDAAACREILTGFKLHMIALEEQYPENIKVNYTEV